MLVKMEILKYKKKKLSHSKNKQKKQKADGVAQGVGPEFKPQYHKKERNCNLYGREIWKQRRCPTVGSRPIVVICPCNTSVCALNMSLWIKGEELASG
jgi:hypothetical protein